MITNQSYQLDKSIAFEPLLEETALETFSKDCPKLIDFNSIISKNNNYFPCSINDFLIALLKTAKFKSKSKITPFCLSWNGKTCTDIMMFQFEIKSNKKKSYQISISKILDNIPSAFIVYVQNRLLIIIIQHNFNFHQLNNNIYKNFHKSIAQNYLMPKLKKMGEFKYVKSFCNYDSLLLLNEPIIHISFLSLIENNLELISGFENLRFVMQNCLGLYSRERFDINDLSSKFIDTFPHSKYCKNTSLELLKIFEEELINHLNEKLIDSSDYSITQLKSLVSYYLFLITDLEIYKKISTRMLRASAKNINKQLKAFNISTAHSLSNDNQNISDDVVNADFVNRKKSILYKSDIISQNLFYNDNNYLKILEINKSTQDNILYKINFNIDKDIPYSQLERDLGSGFILTNRGDKIFCVDADTEFQTLNQNIIDKIKVLDFPRDIQTIKDKWSQSVHNNSLCISRQYKCNNKTAIYYFEDIALDIELSNSPSTLFNFLNIELMPKNSENINDTINNIIEELIELISKIDQDDITSKQKIIFNLSKVDLPFLDIVLLGHFFRVDFLRLFNPKHALYKLLALLIYDCSFVTEKAYGKYLKACENYDALLVPIIVKYENYFYNLRFIFLDSSKINGAVSYKDLIINANLDENIIETKQIEKEGVEKSEMLLAYYNKKEIFEKYALNDLYISEILIKLYNNNKDWLTNVLGINEKVVDEFVKQKLAMGSNTVNLVTTKAIYELFLKDFNIIEYHEGF